MVTKNKIRLAIKLVQDVGKISSFLQPRPDAVFPLLLFLSRLSFSTFLRVGYRNRISRAQLESVPKLELKFWRGMRLEVGRDQVTTLISCCWRGPGNVGGGWGGGHLVRHLFPAFSRPHAAPPGHKARQIPHHAKLGFRARVVNRRTSLAPPRRLFQIFCGRTEARENKAVAREMAASAVFRGILWGGLRSRI